MWHVSSRSGVATLRTAIHFLLTYLLTYCWIGGPWTKGFVPQTTSICSPFRQKSELRQRDRHTTIDRRPVTGPRGTRHLVTRFSRHRHYYTYCTVLCHPLCFHRVTSFVYLHTNMGGSVAERLACWTQAQKGLGSNRSRDAIGKPS